MTTKKRITIKTYFLTMALLIACLILSVYSPKTAAAESASSTSGKQINYFGTVVPCGKDNGYIPNTKSSWNPWTLLTIPGTVMGLIPDDDPHSGWSLGSFYVDGYSAKTDSARNYYQKTMPVYLKNAGDTLSFGFNLTQNINALNSNSKLKIADDKKVIQDCWVNDPYVDGDLGKGVLIIVHTDWQGKETKTVYKDFLTGKSVGANTEVRLFEEGDYRVVLCYEIYKDTAWNWVTDWMDPNGSWFDYRIESYFSVRNGNAMVFPFDIDTGSELNNKSSTVAGFRVDLANSKYLSLTVKKEILNQDGTDIIEDVRFNKALSDGAIITDEGKYTVTVKNVYTDAVTEKIIYVGTNDVMRCNVATGLSVTNIKAQMSCGYTVGEDGLLKEPVKIVEPNHSASAPVTPAPVAPAPITPIAPVTPDIEGVAAENIDIGEDGWIVIGGVAFVAIIVVGIVLVVKN